jgi:hypothetical protein
MLSRVVYKKQRGRRFATALAIFAIVAGSLLAYSAALAVNATGAFELDGNATNNAVAGDDWDNVCHEVLGTDCSTTSNTSGATAVSWLAEPDPSATIFTGGGSKDPQDPGDSWAWKNAGGLPDKDNLLHGFAARYSLAPSATTCPTDPDGGGPLPPFPTCEVIFFGSDRFANDGDAVQGFWFFQDKIELGSTPRGGGSAFTGHHINGDLLLISDFSNGGSVSTINVHKWDTTCPSAANNNPQPGQCSAENLRLLASSNAANCLTSAATAGFCGIVNTGAANVTSPWPFLDKAGSTSFRQGEFFEGGVNLSTLGLGGECFASVASETRSSTSPTATLKDFVLDNFGECTSGIETTPSAGQGGTTSITTAGSISVTDSAELTITGAQTWTGTLAFHICGPLAAGALCTSGGTAAGSSTVTNTTSQPISSSAVTVTSAGRYCWRGDFTSGTNGVPDSSDSSENECFTVTPVDPTLTTNATASVTVGSPISDTAHLGGTANQPGTPVINPTTAGGAAGGTITFTAYGPSDPTCGNSPAFTSSAIPVSGNNDYGSGNFTPTVAGTYKWIASYTGDSPNTNGKTTACNDANETTVVNPGQPTITTTAVAGPLALGSAISDTAHLGNVTAPSNATAGTITFRAYGPATSATDCSTLVYTSVVTVTLVGNGDYNSASGTGGVFTPTAAGTYLWTAAYAPAAGDANNQSATTACGDANESSVIISLTPAISTGQFFYPNDSATVTVAAGGGNLTGNVHFRAWTNNTCTGTPLVDQTKSITTNGTGISLTVETTNTTARISSPTTVVYWQVDYDSTNPAHVDVTGTCGTEHTTLTITNS